MRMALAPHIHLAVLGDDVVLLDLSRDDYVCVPDGVRHLRPLSEAGFVEPAEPAARDALLAAGYARASGRGPPRPRLTRPDRSLDIAFGPPATLGERLRLAAAACDLIVHYRGRAMGRIVAFAAAAQPTAVDFDRTIRLAQLFHRLAPWLPIPRKCLARSFVLMRFLQRSGVAAQWVFGVRTWPFSAHCWLQIGTLALDDHWERLVAYEPILSVG